MKRLGVKEVFEIAKLTCEVVAGVAAYAIMQLNPMLQRPAEGLAIVAAAFAAVWVMGSTPSSFRSGSAFVRKPLLPLLSAFFAYGLLWLVVNYWDENPPNKPWATLADLTIEFIYAGTFGLLTISCSSLLRGIGIDLRAEAD